jgi:CO dehydrogenase nickel-insertion accessory protein CooC1
MRGISTAARMKDLIGELRTKIGRIGLIVNRVRGELSPEMKSAIDGSNLQVVALIPEDPDIASLEMQGKPVTELAQESPLRLKVREIIEDLKL